MAAGSAHDLADTATDAHRHRHAVRDSGCRVIHRPQRLEQTGAESAGARGPDPRSLAAVSRENLDFVLGAYERFNAGERTPELWFWHADGEYETSSADPDSAVHRRIDAIRRQFARWLEAYPDLRVEPLEAKDNGDKVFVWTRFVGHGASIADQRGQ